MGKKTSTNLVGVDLFAGAGGMSLGARIAGIRVALAIERDSPAASTYALNHPNTNVVVKDVRDIDALPVDVNGGERILFGGPPCQGFSTSNQRNRTSQNEANWMVGQFVRLTRVWEPDWVVFENVKGIIETEGGKFRELVEDDLTALGYECTCGILCASDFGVPQFRSRFFLVGSRNGTCLRSPTRTTRRRVSVGEAIRDLPCLQNGANVDYLPYSRKATSRYTNLMRNGMSGCRNHLVTRNAPYVVRRYEHIPPGGNWENIPPSLMRSYTDVSRCHTGIYRRLCADRPSVVLGNYRKNMLVHPWENRGLSVREAARLQSFPDSYVFPRCSSVRLSAASSSDAERIGDKSKV